MTVTPAIDRFAADNRKLIYEAFPHQKAFHESPLRNRLLGGAAGPGKTYALIMDHLLSCSKFSVQDGPQVHSLLLRRTYPKLASTVITRFREKIPKELYVSFNDQKGIVTWHNGSTTQFGSMQYEHDVWGWQGQWYKIGYDELTEFTFSQWNNISAWNRCPVSPHATKDGATNPIGIGAPWVEDLFVKKRPCPEMDSKQRELYSPNQYGYFPATYMDNPIYANDPIYVANLDAYQEAVSRALKFGIWGVAGGYFEGAWDEASNVYRAETFEMKPWYRKWLGGDWGFEHNSAIHWFCMDDLGIVRIYRELVCNHHTPEELAERIASMSRDADGATESYEFFSLSHDAFAQRHDTNPIGIRIGNVLKRFGIVQPSVSTTDKPGREQILYDYLKGRIKTGTVYNDAESREEPVYAARLQIADTCENAISTIPKAPRDEKKSEEIAEFLGDDALQSIGYGLYQQFGKPERRPLEIRVMERLESLPVDMSQKMLQRERIIREEKKSTPGPFKWRQPRTRWTTGRN